MKRNLKILWYILRHPLLMSYALPSILSLRKIGIDAFDEDGNMKNLLTVLQELSDKWAKSMSIECEDDED